MAQHFPTVFRITPSETWWPERTGVSLSPFHSPGQSPDYPRRGHRPTPVGRQGRKVHMGLTSPYMGPWLRAHPEARGRKSVTKRREECWVQSPGLIL